MDVILHVGAHRTATTTFQHYVRDHAAALRERGIGFWGPQRTRQSLFPGLFPGLAAANGRDLVARAEGRVQMRLEQTRADGVQTLLVSDENMIGTQRECLRGAALYPAVGMRMARLSSAFGGQINRIVISLRAQDLWWASAAAYTVGRGHPVPSAVVCAAVADSNRTWRDVITDIACAVPSATITVVPFEQVAGRPEALFSSATGETAPPDRAQRWLNRSPDCIALRSLLSEEGGDADLIPDDAGRWQPFTAEQAAALRDNYADDLHWLIAGADGLATLTEDPTRKRAGFSLPAGDMTKGQADDIGHRQEGQDHMARSG